MKKILGISLVALMSVTAANAEIASKAYVDAADSAISGYIGTIPQVSAANDVIGYVDEQVAGAIETADLSQYETKTNVTSKGDTDTPVYFDENGVATPITAYDGTAARATADASGNVITSTYATKAEVGDTSGLATAYGVGVDTVVEAIAAVNTTAGNALTSSSPLNGANITAGTVPESALDSTTQGKIDGALASSTAATTYATKAEVGDTSGLETTYGENNDTVVEALAAVKNTADNAVVKNNAITASGNTNKIVQYDEKGLVVAGTTAGALATLSAVGSTEITDGSIMNADINASAAINMSKIDFPALTSSTAGEYVLTAEIDSQGATVYHWELISRTGSETDANVRP